MSIDRESSDLDARVARNVARFVSSNATGEIAPEAHETSFAIVEDRLAGHDRRTGRLRVAAFCSLALLAGAGGYWGRARWAAPVDEIITYRVGDGPSLQPGSLIEAAGKGAATDLAFSDGTRVRMEPHARGRVAELDRLGGRVALYNGRAEVNVRHRPNARWLFQAGPFEVHVHGTSFSVAWDSEASRFELTMDSGVVSVTGPVAGGEVELHAGQSLSIALPADPARSGGAGAASATAAGKAPEDAPEQPRPDALEAERREGATTGSPAGAAVDWRRQLADGHAAAVVGSAQRRGIGRVLDHASSEDLAALADAARYVGQDDLARRALVAQRRRFPHSSRAADALFLLGRLEGDSAGGAARALGWYDRYLAEAPGGAYVSEALGRKMMVLEQTERHEEAVEIASAYVGRFPSGSYVHAARALIDGSARSPERARPPSP